MQRDVALNDAPPPRLLSPQNWVVFVVQSFTFGAGLAGISYGALSASYEPGRPGSKLGWTEFRANLPVVLDRLRKGDGVQR